MSRRGPRERPGLLNNFGMAKHCFKSASTASTMRRRSGPGRTYLAQIDVSLRAVGRETLTPLGNSRATAAVTLLLLLYSAPPARTKVPSPILCSSDGHRLVQTACLLSPCWVSARVCARIPPSHIHPPCRSSMAGGHNVPYIGTLAWLSGYGRPPDLVKTRTQAAFSLRTPPLPWYRPCHLSSEARLSLLGCRPMSRGPVLCCPALRVKAKFVSFARTLILPRLISPSKA